MGEQARTKKQGESDQNYNESAKRTSKRARPEATIKNRGRGGYESKGESVAQGGLGDR